MRKISSTLATLFAIAFMFSPCFAHAQLVANFLSPSAQTPNLLALSTSASDQVPLDTVTITLSYTQQSDDPDTLSPSLNRHLEAALQKTKGVDGISVSTGQSIQFTTGTSTSLKSHSTYASWRGIVRIGLTSKDFTAVSKLAKELAPDMKVIYVQFSLSPEARCAAEERLSRKAIALFRAKVAAAVRDLGYRNYVINQFAVTSMPPEWMGDMGVNNIRVPTQETGTTTVTVVVSGAVQMKE